MPNKCEKCGNEKDYNFALNIGLCNQCIIAKIEKLEEALGDILEYDKTYGDMPASLTERIKQALKGEFNG